MNNPINYDDYRNEQGEIDLAVAYQSIYVARVEGIVYLESIMELQPIKSRQVAAVAIANAAHIDEN